MPSRKRFKTIYPGVFYVESTSKLTGKQKKVYFIMYRKDGKKVEEKAGCQHKDAMTPAKASLIRADKITGKLPPNSERRAKARERVTLDFLFDEFVSHKQETLMDQVLPS